MLLISTLAAHDLGYISLGNLLERLEHTFDTFDRMEKRWGHFLQLVRYAVIATAFSSVHLDGGQR